MNTKRREQRKPKKKQGDAKRQDTPTQTHPSRVFSEYKSRSVNWSTHKPTKWRVVPRVLMVREVQHIPHTIHPRNPPSESRTACQLADILSSGTPPCKDDTMHTQHTTPPVMYVATKDLSNLPTGAQVADTWTASHPPRAHNHPNWSCQHRLVTHFTKWRPPSTKSTPAPRNCSSMARNSSACCCCVAAAFRVNATSLMRSAAEFSSAWSGWSGFVRLRSSWQFIQQHSVG